MPKITNLEMFWKAEAFGETVLPDRAILIGQKLVQNAKIEKIHMRHFGWFSTNVNWFHFQCLNKNDRSGNTDDLKGKKGK